MSTLRQAEALLEIAKFLEIDLNFNQAEKISGSDAWLIINKFHKGETTWPKKQIIKLLSLQKAKEREEKYRA